MNRRQLLGAGAASLLAACSRERGGPPTPVRSKGQIIACGRRFPVDARVVPWFEPPYFDAYSLDSRFRDSELEAIQGMRYGTLRTLGGGPIEERLARDPNDFDALREAVDLFVLHYDVCGTSRMCFDVLHDQRKLSVHFLLDVDGTIYQTLDLRERAWHAAKANSRSIGVEIAQIGAWPLGDDTLDEWYPVDRGGPRLALPARIPRGPLASELEARPIRAERIRGTINGNELEQHDFTSAQYRSLAALTKSLCRVFPRIEPVVPRQVGGKVAMDALSEAEYERFSGILGHFHVTTRKVDPGPAFDWERLLTDVRHG